jgi:hypothetical protein
MIEATVYLEKGTHISSLVETLKTLPASICPTYFTEEEGKIVKSNKLDDMDRFNVFLEENQDGFLLYSENKSCIDISLSVDYISVTLYPTDSLSDELVMAFFHSVENYMPLFGYACEYDEYKHRNRNFITIGTNHIESWVGRKLNKYIPGVYWYTLLSNKLLKQHSVNLSDLASEAMSIEAVGDGTLHLLKFFENSEEWKESVDRLDDLCERTEGIFSIRMVNESVAGIKNFLTYDSIIANWR